MSLYDYLPFGDEVREWVAERLDTAPVPVMECGSSSPKKNERRVVERIHLRRRRVAGHH
jgi:hypothetical protein